MVILALMCAIMMLMYGVLLTKIDKPKYDCSLANFHPDYTQAMRQECIKGKVQYERK
jgi:hypothetical protein